MNDIAARFTKYLFLDDPEVEFRISSGTEANRNRFKINLEEDAK